MSNKQNPGVKAIVEFTDAFRKHMDEGTNMDAEDVLPSFQAGWLAGFKFAQDLLALEERQ